MASGNNRRNIGAKEHVERRIADGGFAYTKAEFKTLYGIITGENRWDEADRAHRHDDLGYLCFGDIRLDTYN